MMEAIAQKTLTSPKALPLIEHVTNDKGERGLNFNFHEGQVAAWESKARIIAVIAGSQGGKTSFGPIWLWREIMLKGGGDFIAVTSSYDLFKLKMLPTMLEFFTETLGIARYWRQDRVIEIADPATGKFSAKNSTDKMWARIILRSAQSLGSLESATAVGAWLDEAGQDTFSIEAWEAIRRRLTLARGRILITTTPYNLGWLKQQIVDKATSFWAGGHLEGDPDTGIAVINFPSTANPMFSQEEYDELKASMPDWKFKMFHEGLFERPPGQIYKDFINKYLWEGGHKVEPFEIPKSWAIWVGVDPGAVNTAKIWLAKDPKSDVLYLFRESLEGDKSTPEHAQEAAALAKKHNHHVIMYYVGQKAERQQRLDWMKAGVRNVKEPPVYDVESGIDQVIQLFKTYRLYIFDDCIGTLDQLARYSRMVDSFGSTLVKIKDKDQFHYLDALRYGALGAENGKNKLRVGAQPEKLADHRGN